MKLWIKSEADTVRIPYAADFKRHKEGCCTRCSSPLPLVNLRGRKNGKPAPSIMRKFSKYRNVISKCPEPA